MELATVDALLVSDS